MISKDVKSAIASLAIAPGGLPIQIAAEMVTNVDITVSEVVSNLTVYYSDVQLVEALSSLMSVTFVDVNSTENTYSACADLAEQVSKTWLIQNNVLPARREGDSADCFILANSRGSSDSVEYLRSVFGSEIEIVQGVRSQIIAELVKLDTGSLEDAAAAISSPDSASKTSSSPVVAWIDQLMARAVAEGASDVHFMTQEDKSLLVRFRIDGKLRKQIMPLKGREGEVVGSILSRCPTIDPSDRMRPQDGSFPFYAAEGRKIDTRLAMLPQVHGPIIVVRLLDPMNVQRRLDSMGFAPKTLDSLREASQAPQGLVLIIGPTGSGKTTTLYAVLNELDSMGKNILTAEDPVEYRLPNIGQTQIRSDLGEKSLTFARASRAFLRLDPDIILVGEIRDSETANIVMHAALTGHLVLSTIHANSALGVFTRLGELGAEPFMVAEALALAVSQRLIGRVHDCHEMVPPTPSQAAFLQRMDLRVPELVAQARGCNACNGTGYKGRIPVMEVLRPTDKVRELVSIGAPTKEVVAATKASDGWTSILEDALRHVEMGTSTVEEMLRVLDTGDGA